MNRRVGLHSAWIDGIGVLNINIPVSWAGWVLHPKPGQAWIYSTSLTRRMSSLTPYLCSFLPYGWSGYSLTPMEKMGFWSFNLSRIGIHKSMLANNRLVRHRITRSIWPWPNEVRSGKISIWELGVRLDLRLCEERAGGRSKCLCSPCLHASSSHPVN